MPRIKVEQDYRQLRRDEYERRGLSLEALTIAMIEDDQTEIQRIRAARGEVKALFPKPPGDAK